jgi:hydrogenase maturation protease
MSGVKTLIVGLGNPILGDDGVGWRVAEMLREQLASSDVEVACLALGGLSLMERLIGYDWVIIIDAIQSENRPIGEVSLIDLQDVPDLTTGHTTAVHDTSLHAALKLGQQMGAKLPESIQFVTIEAESVFDFSEEMTAAVKTAVPQAVGLVLDLIETTFS